MGIGIFALVLFFLFNLPLLLKIAFLVLAATGIGTLGGFIIDRLAGSYPTFTTLGSLFFGLGALGGALTAFRQPQD